jgi:hypothetical protein
LIYSSFSPVIPLFKRPTGFEMALEKKFVEKKLQKTVSENSE